MHDVREKMSEKRCREDMSEKRCHGKDVRTRMSGQAVSHGKDVR